MQAQGVSREVFRMPPRQRGQVKPVVGAVERVGLLFAGRQGDDHVEAAA